ncbi:MAG TPA: hypothetical protein VFF31_32260 [Blastocatellia bacterium]|nr:hypothetical protein [Blastocatellia bacterium]
MVARRKAVQDFIPIPLGDVAFHPHSFADDAGRLFRWSDKLWRGISYEQAPFFDKLFRDGTILDLVDRGLLIETEPTNLSLTGYASIVSHRTVPFVSYPNEWCAGMLKDASLTILDLAIELTHRRLTLKDAHPWNVLFDGYQPVYVDLTSIAPQKDRSTWSAYDEFCRFCHYPLILMSHGQERIARSLLPEYQGVLRSEVTTVTRGSFPSMFLADRLLRRGFNSILSIIGKEPARSTLAFLKRARRGIEAIRLPSYKMRDRRRLLESMISPSYEAEGPSLPLTLRKILTTLRPGSILDLSRGPTWTTIVPATMGFEVVSLDPDAARISALHETARRKKLSILPLIVDFIKPTPSIGYASHYSIAATDRLKCDLVLALGLADKIRLENHFNVDLIAEGLASFSKRWLVVSFSASKHLVPKSTAESNSTLGRPEDFMTALRKRFRDVNVFSSDAQTEVLLCEK